MASRESKDGLLAMIRNGEIMSLRQQLLLVMQLSLPAMIAQLSTIAMNYIDASMVGSLGAAQSASIGLVSTTIWLFAGLCNAFCVGFSVQVAHYIGAKRYSDARSVVRQGLTCAIVVGLFFMLLGAAISPFLPIWLGGNEEISADATSYFLIFTLCLPLLVVNFLASGMLRCSGDIRTPSILNTLMCVLDVVFNYFLIFPTREVAYFGDSFVMPGAGLGVTGAALGTAGAMTVVSLLSLFFLVVRSKDLSLRQEKGSFRPTRPVVLQAMKFSSPMALQQAMMSSAYMMTTIIVASLGTVSIAANALAIEAESVCYMPGYGISEASTTLVGQSLGAGRRFLCRQFAHISLFLAMGVMGLMGLLMYCAAPLMMGVLTCVPEVIDQGTQVLRIEAFAEPLFAAAIVCYGAFIGAGDTRASAIMNVVSMWLVRVSLAWFLVRVMNFGLIGMWVAMAAELCFRGTIFMLRLWFGNWMKATVIKN